MLNLSALTKNLPIKVSDNMVATYMRPPAAAGNLSPVFHNAYITVDRTMESLVTRSTAMLRFVRVITVT